MDTSDALKILRESIAYVRAQAGLPKIRPNLLQPIGIQKFIPRPQYQPVNKAQTGQAGGEEVKENIALSQVAEPQQPAPSPSLPLPTGIVQTKFQQGLFTPVRTSISNLITATAEAVRTKAEVEAKKEERLEIEKRKPKPSIRLRSG